MKIIRRDYAQGAGKEEQKVDDDQLALDRLIYRKLGSLTDNKIITTPESNDTDFRRFLLDMNNLHNHKYYPSITAGTPIPTSDLKALDKYLGELGETEVYPFKEDTYNTEAWVTVDAQGEYRILFDESDTTYLVDPADGSILVSYT